MKDIWYPTEGTCSRFIHVHLSDDNVIENIEFIGGCNGNLKGISSLLKGQRAEDIIARTQGITCGTKPTSCPDQLSKALAKAIEAAR